MSRRLLILAFVLLSGLDAARPDESRDPEPDQIDLSHLVDRTDLSFEESGSYYALLDHVRNVPDAELRAEAAEVLLARWEDSPEYQRWPESEFPLFYELTQQPQAYRGRPISMRGHLVRLVTYPAGPNDHGIDTLYEGWLVTPDAASHPTTIICTEIPPGLPIGEDLIDGISVTGYFFKLHTYPSRDRKTRFAPMVLARTMTWSPPGEAADRWPVSQPVMISALLLLALLVGLYAWISSRRNRALRDARFCSDVPEEGPGFLKDLTP